MSEYPKVTARLTITRFDDLAQLPVRSSPGAAGLDLFACCDLVIPPGEWRPVSTGIGLQISPGFYGRVAPRSGLALRHGIDVLAGVIDSDYRGEVICLLMNHGDSPFEIVVGNRIAQLIVEPVEMVDPIWGESESTRRGDHGFGSSGR